MVRTGLVWSTQGCVLVRLHRNGLCMCVGAVSLMDYLLEEEDSEMKC